MTLHTSRQVGETVVIAGVIRITVKELRRRHVQLSIDAPADVGISYENTTGSAQGQDRPPINGEGPCLHRQSSTATQRSPRSKL